MSSFRVYEIAGQLNISSDEVIKMGKELGLDLKSHSSVLTQAQLEKIADVYNKIKTKTQTNKNAAINNTESEIKPPGVSRNGAPAPEKTLNIKVQEKDAVKVVTQYKPVSKRGIVSSKIQWKPVPKRGETVKEALSKVILKEEETKLATPQEEIPKVTTVKEKILKAPRTKVKTTNEKVLKIQAVQEKDSEEKISGKQDVLKKIP